MDYGKSYSRTIKSIDDEIKRMNLKKKTLLDEKRKTEEKLYHWMRNNRFTEFEGFKLDKIKPKDNLITVRRGKKEKEDDAIRLLMETGIPDPVELYKQLQSINKPKKVEKV